MTKLAATLPKHERNGLGLIAGDLVHHPHQTHVIIAVVDCKKVTTDMDTGDVVPTARIRRVEVVDPEIYGLAERVMRDSIERRNGGAWLPIEEFDEEIKQIFQPKDVSNLVVLEDRPGRS